MLKTLLFCLLILANTSTYAATAIWQFEGYISNISGVANEISNIQTGDYWSARFQINTHEIGTPYQHLPYSPVHPSIKQQIPSRGTSTQYANLSGQITVGNHFSYHYSAEGQLRVFDELSYIIGHRDSIHFTDTINTSIEGILLKDIGVSLYGNHRIYYPPFDDPNLGELSDTNLSSALIAGLTTNALNMKFLREMETNNLNDSFRNRGSITGTVTSSSVSVSEVPLPSALWLFASTLLVLTRLKSR